jgi:hypothetical protein
LNLVIFPGKIIGAYQEDGCSVEEQIVIFAA